MSIEARENPKKKFPTTHAGGGGLAAEPPELFFGAQKFCFREKSRKNRRNPMVFERESEENESIIERKKKKWPK